MRLITLMLGTVLIVAGQTPRVSRAAALAPTGSFIGVGVQEIDGERAKALKLREEAGVEVTRVDPDSPAEKAGLKTGDAVLQYNGQRVEGIEQFSRLVRETPPGRDVKLDIIRGGAPQTVTVKVGMRPLPRVAGGFGLTPPDIRFPDLPRSFLSWRSAMLGVEAESLEGQLAEYFGVKDGVLVRSVLKGSAAEKAGIKAGDVITRVDNSKVATPADLSNRLRSLRNQSVPVVLMRDHKEMTISVTIDDADRAKQIREQNFGSGGPAHTIYSIQQ
jgi:serine protease Do